MEDTWFVCFLVPHHVGPPAQQGPEVHVSVGSVADHTVPGAGREGGGW